MVLLLNRFGSCGIPDCRTHCPLLRVGISAGSVDLLQILGQAGNPGPGVPPWQTLSWPVSSTLPLTQWEINPTGSTTKRRTPEECKCPRLKDDATNGHPEEADLRPLVPADHWRRRASTSRGNQSLNGSWGWGEISGLQLRKSSQSTSALFRVWDVAREKNEQNHFKELHRI